MPKYRIRYITEVEIEGSNSENALQKAIIQNKIAIESVVLVRKTEN